MAVDVRLTCLRGQAKFEYKLNAVIGRAPRLVSNYTESWQWDNELAT